MNRQLAQSQVQAHTVVTSDQQRAANARLHGGPLILARICWLVLAVLSLTIFIAGLPLYFADIQLVCNTPSSCDVGQLLFQSTQVLQNLGISVGGYAVMAIVMAITIALIWFFVGGLIFWRKSDEPVALLISLGLVLYSGSQVDDPYLLTVSNPTWTIPVAFVQFFALTALVLSLFLFPDGKFVPRWMSWLAAGLVVVLIDIILLPTFIPAWPIIPWNSPFFSFFVVLFTCSAIGLVVSQIYRYRLISSPVQRRQTRLVFFAFIIFLLVLVGFTIGLQLVVPTFFPALNPPDPLNQMISGFVQNFLPLLIPISLGIALFRYRLWDIDIIIKRTLVYTALTGSLAVVYIACILVLQAPLSGFTGGNSIALVVSTLAIAALFHPLRRHIQTIIDRRFYRRKYDAARTIAAFSASLRGEVDLNKLSEQLVAVVQETMQPASVSLWLQKRDRQGQLHYRKSVADETAPSREAVDLISETEGADKPAEPPRPSLRKIPRRPVLIGLAAGGVVLAGGGLSWWLLRRRATFTYTGHTDWVYDVAWSPDGIRIASTSKDRTVQIWDASDGNRIFTFRGHTSDVFTAGWSPDGKRIASCSQDKTVQVWDATTGGHVFTYRGHRDAVVIVAWSPEGRRLASGGGNLDYTTDRPSDDTVQVWDATDGRHVLVYGKHTDGVQAVIWSPDGRRIASASLDKTVQVWDAADGSHVLTYRGHTDHVLNVAWSPDGKYLASCGVDTTVQIWNAADGSHVFTYTGHTDWVTGVAWSPDSKRIASASSDKTAQVWDAADGGHVFVYNGHTNAVITTAWSPDGTHIATSSFDDTVQIWSPG